MGRVSGCSGAPCGHAQLACLLCGRPDRRDTPHHHCSPARPALLGHRALPSAVAAALRDYLFDNLPLTRQQQLETYLEISFWGRALANDTLREVQRKESAELHETVEQLLVTAEKRGELTPGDARARAEILLALVDGLSLHALLYPERLPAERTKVLMEAQLDQWRAEEALEETSVAGAH